MKENTGQLDLIFRKKENGDTYLAKKYFKSPLQVLSTYYQDEDGTAFLYLLNPSGGILQHDRLFSRIKVEKDAKAFITTPGNTKFYKMDEGHAEIENHYEVEKGGVLEYLPEHNVPFAGSSTYQNSEFHLHSDSILIASDLVTAGRVSRGEVFQYKIYSSKTKIFVDGELMAYDRTLMEPEKDDLSRLGLLEGYKSNGSMFIYKKDMDEDLIDDIRNIEYSDGIHFGASMVTPSLMIIRFLGDSIIDIQDTLREIWSITRRTLLGKESVRIRKY